MSTPNPRVLKIEKIKNKSKRKLKKTKSTFYDLDIQAG